MDERIEYIIRNFSFSQLTENQKELISEWAENSDEFEALKMSLTASDSLKKSLEQELNPVIKQRLDVRFAEKYNHQRLAWYNRLFLFLWPENTPIYKKPLVQFASIALLTVITVQLIPEQTKQKLAFREPDKNETIVDPDSLAEKEEQLKTQRTLEVDQKDIESGKTVKSIDEMAEEKLVSKELSQPQPVFDGFAALESRSTDGVSFEGYDSSTVMDAEVPQTTSGWELNGQMAGISKAKESFDRDDSRSVISKNRETIVRKVQASETVSLISALY
ncbi:MAG: hypothetical protein R3277_11615 [Brumimicrobium sp.]|nr:hypothetical protein [Brumimicrobium sp.]